MKNKVPSVVQDVIDLPNPIKDSNIESKTTNKIAFHVIIKIKLNLYNIPKMIILCYTKILVSKNFKLSNSIILSKYYIKLDKINILN